MALYIKEHRIDASGGHAMRRKFGASATPERGEADARNPEGAGGHARSTRSASMLATAGVDVAPKFGREEDHPTMTLSSLERTEVRGELFGDRIRAVYDRQAPKHIHPYIGAAFNSPSATDLRIMAVGINSYVSPHDEGKESPAWFAGWFMNQTYRYQKSLWRSLKAFGEKITTPPFRLASKKFRGMDALLVTNAIKTYVPEHAGKRAAQLAKTDYVRNLDQWHDELDVMAEANVLPHVLAIIGEPFWRFACTSFRHSSFKSVKTKTYEWCKGSCRRFVNRITIDGPHGEHEILLVRLRHPAARTAKGSPKWLLEQDEFRALASR